LLPSQRIHFSCRRAPTFFFLPVAFVT
jgi:hypothetical protein